MAENIPSGIQILDGNEPVDLGAMLCRGMMEFFVNHMGDTAIQQFGNFMAAAEDKLLSKEGTQYCREGFEKLGGSLG